MHSRILYQKLAQQTWLTMNTIHEASQKHGRPITPYIFFIFLSCTFRPPNRAVFYSVQETCTI